MSGVIARIVEQKRRRPRKLSEEDLAIRAAGIKANAKPGDCPVCGGPAMLIGNVYSEKLPRKCRFCGHEYQLEEVHEEMVKKTP